MFVLKEKTPFRAQATGVTLIEILITILVLSVGLLGVGALQGIALQSSQLANQRTQATMLAARIADEYRAYRDLDEPPQALQQNWENEIQRLLPNGSLEHQQDNQVITITISWRDQRVVDGQPGNDDRITFAIRK